MQSKQYLRKLKNREKNENRWTDLGYSRNFGGYVLHTYKCLCGTIREVKRSHVDAGSSKSCGCLQRDVSKKVHTKTGMNRTKVHKAWRAMIDRCENPKNKAFHNYGGRGVKVCKRWKNFYNFLEDMGQPDKGMFLDRIDFTGNYEPSNCRWVTMEVSCSNRRTSIFLTLDGIKDTVSGHARRFNIRVGTVYSRLKNKWPVEEAFKKTPTNKFKAKLEKE